MNKEVFFYRVKSRPLYLANVIAHWRTKELVCLCWRSRAKKHSKLLGLGNGGDGDLSDSNLELVPSSLKQKADKNNLLGCQSKKFNSLTSKLGEVWLRISL